MSASHESLIVLGTDFGHLSPKLQFLVGASGAVVFYMIYAYFMELVFSFEGIAPYSWYLTLVMFTYYTMIAFIENLLSKKDSSSKKVPMRMYCLFGVMSAITYALSNYSLVYLNYPTQVIFKSCKLIPTMIAGILIQGKRYSLADVVAMLAMIFGLVWFTLADSSVHPTFNLYGILLVCMCLCVDGTIGNLHEKTMKAYNSTSTDMVLYSYGFGVLCHFAGVVFTGTLVPAFNYFSQHPVETYGYIFLFSVCGYLGLQFTLLVVKSYGVFPSVFVSIFRRTFTIVFSFILFAKPFTFHYVFAGLILLSGFSLNLYCTMKKKDEELQAKSTKKQHLS